MPLYEYQCSSCGHRFEKIRKFSDPPYKKCDKCGKMTAEQLLSAPAAHFKGEGWYVTDYGRKSSSQGSAGPHSTGDKVESSASSESKSDSKSEAKSDSTPKTETKAESKSETKSSAKKSDSKRS